MILDLNNYHNTFPDYPVALMLASDDRWYGNFNTGNSYRKENNYYGAYPPRFLKRILALFSMHQKILHLFSGTVEIPGHVSLDINFYNSPTVCANAEKLPFGTGTFDLIIADPPYRKEDAVIYGFKMPNRIKVMKEAARVTQEGGALVWLDINCPIWSKEKWDYNWDYKGIISLFSGSNRLIRSVILFERI